MMVKPARQPYPFFDYPATEIGVHEALHHFQHRVTKGAVRQLRLAHPAAKVTGLECSRHSLIVPLSVLIQARWGRKTPSPADMPV